MCIYFTLSNYVCYNYKLHATLCCIFDGKFPNQIEKSDTKTIPKPGVFRRPWSSLVMFLASKTVILSQNLIFFEHLTCFFMFAALLLQTLKS